LKLVKKALDDMKAVDVRLLDVRGLSDIADWMIVASGNSDRHVRSIADHVVQQAKASGTRPFGTEGGSEGEWVLVDLPDVLVHVMLPRVREFYALEELWDRPAAKAPAARVPATARKPPAARLPPAARKPAAASKPGARRGATRAR
jgi:ribosome-associated protein